MKIYRLFCTVRRIMITKLASREEIYFTQQFIVTGGLDCRLRSTIYTRISERNILTWIQEVTGTGH